MQEKKSHAGIKNMRLCLLKSCAASTPITLNTTDSTALYIYTATTTALAMLLMAELIDQVVG
jgi:hypothetical protein